MAKTNRHILFGNKLLQYSALSGAFILGKPDFIFAEVVYTNIEPDVVLDEDDEDFFLDFNGDLDSDVHFLNVSNFSPELYQRFGPIKRYRVKVNHDQST